MIFRIVTAGLQTTLQASPREGQRHLGVPASGAADRLSLALANRLLGNELSTPAFEITLTSFVAVAQVDVAIAITGAVSDCYVNGAVVRQHSVVNLNSGDLIEIGASRIGARCYLAVAGGLRAEHFLGSVSTYMPAVIGGHDGRALCDGDVIQCLAPRHCKPLQTPAEFELPMQSSTTLRVVPSAEAKQTHLSSTLFVGRYRVSADGNRMGVPLDGERLTVNSTGTMASAPVFPGTIQCPEDGRPIVLGVDAQTTGGYPRIAQVARSDRHRIGQLRPGAGVNFIERDAALAGQELSAAHAYWSRWLPDVRRVI